uniref:RIIa domain-containing protein n=1 Tax=Labrus bergylta TaxID=56723 RepID=A0A3Q3MJJ7_9LABR
YISPRPRCLYQNGLQSELECVTRAVSLSQPNNLHEFLLQYFTELISYRESQPEMDPKIIILRQHKLWGATN